MSFQPRGRGRYPSFVTYKGPCRAHWSAGAICNPLSLPHISNVLRNDAHPRAVHSIVIDAGCSGLGTGIFVNPPNRPPVAIASCKTADDLSTSGSVPQRQIHDLPTAWTEVEMHSQRNGQLRNRCRPIQKWDAGNQLRRDFVHEVISYVTDLDSNVGKHFPVWEIVDSDEGLCSSALDMNGLMLCMSRLPPLSSCLIYSFLATSSASSAWRTSSWPR